MTKRLEQTAYSAENTATSVLEEILSDAQTEATALRPKVNFLPLLGVVTDTVDPKQHRRIRVRWQIDETAYEEWLHRTAGFDCVPGDTVLVQSVKNRPEPIATAVLEKPPENSDVKESETAQKALKTAPKAAPAVVLSQGTSVQIVAENGNPLVEVSSTDDGPKLKLLCADTIIDIPGDLSVNAKSIKLTATSGKAELVADDDVVVIGKNIYLN